MIRRPPRSTLSSSSAASDVYKRQAHGDRLAGDAEVARTGGEDADGAALRHGRLAGATDHDHAAALVVVHLPRHAVGDYARLDVSRAARKGVPEVVYAEGKSAEQLIGIVARFLDHSPLVLCSRVSAEQAAALADGVPGKVDHDERSRVVVVRRAGEPPVPERGAVGVLAAGTSDVGVAGEDAD